MPTTRDLGAIEGVTTYKSAFEVETPGSKIDRNSTCGLCQRELHIPQKTGFSDLTGNFYNDEIVQVSGCDHPYHHQCFAKLTYSLRKERKAPPLTQTFTHLCPRPNCLSQVSLKPAHPNLLTAIDSKNLDNTVAELSKICNEPYYRLNVEKSVPYFYKSLKDDPDFFKAIINKLHEKYPPYDRRVSGPSTLPLCVVFQELALFCDDFEDLSALDTLAGAYHDKLSFITVSDLLSNLYVRGAYESARAIYNKTSKGFTVEQRIEIHDQMVRYQEREAYIRDSKSCLSRATRVCEAVHGFACDVLGSVNNAIPCLPSW